MSFLKITDPAKRDFIVNEFLKTKRSIQQHTLSDKLGEDGMQQELIKLYKPITESQAGLATQLSAIKEATSGTASALKALPASQLKALTFPQYQSIEDPVESVRTLELGDIATRYLQQHAANQKAVDRTFGIYSKDGQFYIGTSPITIHGDDITVGSTTYTGTPGLWELMTMVKPNESIYDSDDLENYTHILDETNAIRNPANPNKPRSSRSDKYRKIIRPIWERISQGETAQQIKKGKGVNATIILPSDPNALVERLPLLLAGYKAGNTGTVNEVVAICDELLRQEVLNKDTYKTIMTQIAVFV